ncbi:MAG: 1-acyl-sn-glycerol-3-phosphate acyltransferase [Pseudomonadota bacterium]
MRSLLFNIWFYSGTAVLALAAFLISPLAGTRTMRGMLHFWTRMALWGVRNLLGAKIEVLGRETLPNDGRPTVIVSKHQSELDAILLLNLYPDLGAIAMQELERYPFVGRIIRKLGYILVPVSGPPAGRTEAVISGARRVLSEGRPVLIYPEGILMKLGARARYRSGVFRIHEALEVPVHPVAMSVGVIWPQRRWRKTAGATGGLRFLPPIEPGLDHDAFMERLESQIETATITLIEAHASPEVATHARQRWERRAGNDD